MPTTRRTRLIIALLAATFGAFTVPFLMAMISPPLHPTPQDKNSPAYQLAASDQAATPSALQLAPYQEAIANFTARCPQLDDITVRVTQTRQALHDQAYHDVSALEILQGVVEMLGANPDPTACSAVFALYLTQQIARLGG